MKLPAILTAIFFACTGCVQAQTDPWPLERQDRWGTGRAIMGPDPSLLTTPWISNRLAVGYPVSHGASLRADGIGYFGDWVDNRVYKFDYNSGAVLGSFLAGQFTESVPALAANQTIVCGTDQQAIGVDTTIMDYNWFLQNIGYIGGSPNIGPDGNTVFASSNGNVYRLNPVNGLPTWIKSGYGTPHGTVMFTRDDSKIIVSHDSTVAALNYVDGSPAWSQSFSSTTYCPAVSPSGTILVGSTSGTEYALSPVDGHVLWTWATLAAINGGASFSPDGTVAYVPSTDDRIYALRVADGVRLWSFTTSAPCPSATLVGFDGSIYVHNTNGDLYRLAPDGHQVWQAHLNGGTRGSMTMGPDGTLYVGYTGSTSGLAMVRQQALSYSPDSATILLGVEQSGGLDQILTSDDNYWVVRRGVPATVAVPPVQLQVTTHVSLPNAAGTIKVTLEAHASASPLSRSVYLWNVGGNRWDLVEIASETTSDSTTTVTVSNAQNYVDSGGQIKAKLAWIPTGSIPFLNWSVSVDYVHFDVVPQFIP